MFGRFMTVAIMAVGISLVAHAKNLQDAGCAVFSLNDKNAESFFDASMTEGEFRIRAVKDPDVAVRMFFGTEARQKWAAKTGMMGTELLRDFFYGAIALRGPFDGTSSLAGLYNPWSDILLLTETAVEQFVSDEGSEPIRKVHDFVLMDGAVFRGELKRTNLPGAFSYPAAELLTVSAARRYNATEARFNRLYPQSEIPLLREHPEADSEQNILRLTAAAAVRLKTASSFLDDRKSYAAAYNWVAAFPRVRSSELKLAFDAPASDMMNRTFARMPRRYRKDFRPYIFLTDPANPAVRSCVFVNGKYPRLAVEMHEGLGVGKNIFFWFDFAHADTLTQMAPAKPASVKPMTAKLTSGKAVTE